MTDYRLLLALASLAESVPESWRAAHLAGPAREMAKRVRPRNTEPRPEEQ